MQRGLISLVLFGAIGVAVYFAIANRNLSIRLRNAEELLQSVPEPNAESDIPQAVVQRRVPQRIPALDSAPPGGPDVPVETGPLVIEASTDEAENAPSQETVVRETVIMPGAVILNRVPPAFPFAVAGPEWSRYVGRNGGNCVVNGTSNIHDWRMESKTIAGQISLAPGLDFADTRGFSEFPTNLLCSATAVIPVRSLKNDSPVMNDLMEKALDVERFPNIRYELRALFLKATPTQEQSALVFNSLGDLTLHGVTNQVEMPVTIQSQPSGFISVTASASLRMTDFGIQPPQHALAMGLVKADDELRITFDWKLQRVATGTR